MLSNEKDQNFIKYLKFMYVWIGIYSKCINQSALQGFLWVAEL